MKPVIKPVKPKGEAMGNSDDTAGELSVSRQVEDWRGGQSKLVDDQIVEEQAIALVYNGISHVVMMATPDHLEDFALGFSLSEGILNSPSELYGLELSVREVTAQEKGIEVAMEISAECFSLLKQARRNMTGRTGCGLCGAESLEQAIREPEPISGSQKFTHRAIEQAVSQLDANQALQALTGAVHGAAWCDNEGNVERVREDVGRHNALDKLYGSLCGEKHKLSADHFVLISSRASYELVIKAAAMGVEMLVAVSAPTRLAIELAERVNITLVGFARPGRHMVYTHPHRLTE